MAANARRRRELSDANVRIAELEAENASLRKELAAAKSAGKK